jgi:hypothetical protein
MSTCLENVGKAWENLARTVVRSLVAAVMPG